MVNALIRNIVNAMVLVVEVIIIYLILRQLYVFNIIRCVHDVTAFFSLVFILSYFKSIVNGLKTLK